MACRGSGQVISNLGGSPSMLTCPWCEGGGVRPTDVDAQARWPPADAAAAEPAAVAEAAAVEPVAPPPESAA
jgi:hypothetical protein